MKQELSFIDLQEIKTELTRLFTLNKEKPSTYYYSKSDYDSSLRSKILIFYVPFVDKFLQLDMQKLVPDYFNMNKIFDHISILNQSDIKVIDEKCEREWRQHTFYFKETIALFKEKYPYNGLETFKEQLAIARNQEGYDYNSSFNAEDIEYLIKYIKYPQIEKLLKSGFLGIVKRIINHDGQLTHRNFKNKNSLDEITNLPKFAWSMLRDENINDLSLWNEYRIWIQKDNLTKDQLSIILNLNIHNISTIHSFRKVLNKDFEGRKLYTFDSLLNYLSRVDMYQAIRPMDALLLLEDYIRMAIRCDVEPLIDSNSLKRDHDVMMRNYNIIAREEAKQFQSEKGALFEDRCKELQKYEYKADGLIAIAPRTIQDVLQEGRNNHNCIASYVDKIAKGSSNIFFIRREDSPDRSYITIDLNSDFTKKNQAFYSSNREITSIKDLSFIKNWLENNKEINNNKTKLAKETIISGELDYELEYA